AGADVVGDNRAHQVESPGVADAATRIHAAVAGGGKIRGAGWRQRRAGRSTADRRVLEGQRAGVVDAAAFRLAVDRPGAAGGGAVLQDGDRGDSRVGGGVVDAAPLGVAAVALDAAAGRPGDAGRAGDVAEEAAAGDADRGRAGGKVHTAAQGAAAVAAV